MRYGSKFALVAAFFAVLAHAPVLRAGETAPSVIIVTDSCPPEADLEATGLFSAVDTFDHAAGTPTLLQLQGYDAVFAYTNDSPKDPTALGNVLADYADLGGCLSLATYGFSDGWSFAGRVMTPGYSPFLFTPTEELAEPDGAFIATVPYDALFDGVDLGLMDYQFNENMADGALDAGAKLLATDGLGLHLVARAAGPPIVGFNLYAVGEAGGNDCGDNNAETFRMIANSLANCRGVFSDGFEEGTHCSWSTAVPSPCI
jgi:hypothetical protein